MSRWYAKTVDEALRDLGADAKRGLAPDAVRERREQYGPNELTDTGGKSPWAILLQQFASLMVLLLIAAAVVSGFVLGEWQDMGVILVVVVLNAALGFRQEYQAEKAMEKLKQLSVPTVRVRRGGEAAEVAATELVPGDVVLLEAGDFVPADCRLLEAPNLRIEESSLTGEAAPVGKSTDALPDEEAALGDRRCMAYMGAAVSYGRGVALVTATGMRTELGRIATMLQGADEDETVLQKKLDHLSKLVVALAFGLIAVVTLEGWLLQEMSLKALFLTGVSMAVAAIPESLPAVVTISLALGAQRMLRRNALIRRLPAVETLGSVTVICSDKTGTLTQNRMTVMEVESPGADLDLPSAPQRRRRRLREAVEAHPAVALTVAAGALCTNATIRTGEGESDHFETVGDPTEGALVAAAWWVDWTKDALEDRLPRVGERPFDSERKRMSTLHRLPDPGADVPAPLREAFDWLRANGDGAVVAAKGAVDSLLGVCNRIWTPDGVRALDDAARERLEAANRELAGDGIRVLGVACRPAAPGEGADALERELIYVGLVGLLDPLREEVRTAVDTCRRAGVRPVMITGDHPLIAGKIASDLHLQNASARRTGVEVARMDAAALREEVEDVSVYARVAPEHKLRIVKALRDNGEIVAMTGDGVNDAPALKQADIGVAMGITGTDVSQEAADMVLRDDNFATIVAAVEEGRVIYDNISRFVRYILSSNLAEILVMLLAPFCGMPLPLLPVQILWLNLVSDGLPALALGVEPGEPGVMERRPRSPETPIFTRPMALHMLWVGCFVAVVSLVVGWLFFDGSGGGAGHGAAGRGALRATTWRTMIFTTIVFAQLALSLSERADRASIFTIGFFSNPHMVGALALTFGLQVAVVYTPFLQQFFHTAALDFGELAICMLGGGSIFVVLEVVKAIRRLRADGGA